MVCFSFGVKLRSKKLQCYLNAPGLRYICGKFHLLKDSTCSKYFFLALLRPLLLQNAASLHRSLNMMNIVF